MRKPKRDDEREERITMEIIVDCYNEYEVRTGWSCYLDGKLAFPFQAECVQVRRGSPLEIGERFTVTGLFDDDETEDALAEMQVLIDWNGRELAVPLAQIVGVKVSAATSEAIADWHYWVTQGRAF